MAKLGMLGKTSLSVWQRLRNDLEIKIAGSNGNEWVDALKALSRFGVRRFLELSSNTNIPEMTPLGEMKGVKLCALSKRIFIGEAGIPCKGEIHERHSSHSDHVLIEECKVIFGLPRNLEATIINVMAEHEADESKRVDGAIRFYLFYTGQIVRVLATRLHNSSWSISSTGASKNSGGYKFVFELD